jgi:hypothetical protein
MKYEVLTQYGEFTKEADGRLNGHVLYVGGLRRDGKVKVTHAFGHGPRINHIYTISQLQAEIAKVNQSAEV